MILQRGRYNITGVLHENAGFSIFSLTDNLLGLTMYGEKIPMGSFALWFELKRALQIRTTLSGDFFPTVKTFFLEHESLFFLYENLPEHNLAEAKIPKPLKKWPEITAGIINGLSILQQSEMIHGNLRPENIFFTENGAVKLLGLSLRTIPRGTGIFLPEHPVYSAPEIIRNPSAADTGADIYALGGLISLLLLPENESGSANNLSALPVLQRELIRKCRAESVNERYRELSDIKTDILKAAADKTPETVTAQKPALPLTPVTTKEKKINISPATSVEEDTAEVLVDRLHLAHKKNQHQRQIALLIEISKCRDIKPHSIDYIRSLLGQCNDFFVLATVIKTIGKISPDPEWGSLSRFLKHSDSRVAANTVEALSIRNEPRLFNFLEGLLHEETLQNEGRTRVLCAGIPFLKKYHPEAAIEAMRLLSIGNQEAVSTYAFLLGKWEKSESLLHKYTLQLLKSEIRIEVATACMSYIEKFYDDDCLHRLLMIAGTMTDSTKKKLITDFLNKIKPD